MVFGSHVFHDDDGLVVADFVARFVIGNSGECHSTFDGDMARVAYYFTPVTLVVIGTLAKRRSAHRGSDWELVSVLDGYITSLDVGWDSESKAPVRQ